MLTCENCGHETVGKDCDKCGGENPSDARYCCYCGKLLQEKLVERKDKKDKKSDPYDMENRTLCPDGCCIGIINEKGVCTECGRTYEGD